MVKTRAGFVPAQTLFCIGMAFCILYQDNCEWFNEIQTSKHVFHPMPERQQVQHWHRTEEMGLNQNGRPTDRHCHSWNYAVIANINMWAVQTTANRWQLSWNDVTDLKSWRGTIWWEKKRVGLEQKKKNDPESLNEREGWAEGIWLGQPWETPEREQQNMITDAFVKIDH